jgi:tetratricopeptide (TPR) repeat protein
MLSYRGSRHAGPSSSLSFTRTRRGASGDRMDEEDIQDDLDRTTAIGIENAQILALAANWCEHIGVARGPMGVGLVEQATGLPVGGGSLRCSYARAPTHFGMQLKFNAADFYEENCIGCPHHKPTGREPHLGTWADTVLAQRDEQASKAAKEQRREQEKRRDRSERRRFLLGTPDPAVQAILDLIERVDAEEPDPEAERLLLKHAELSPPDFPDALLNHLASEGLAIGRGALLEVVFKIFERAGRPSLEAVCNLAFAGVRDGIAAEAAGALIAPHATEIPVDERTRKGLVRLAAGTFEFRSDWEGARPDALLRFFDLDPNGASRTVSALLRDAEPWARATAAHAAQGLVRNRPAAGDSLLQALLASVVMEDRSRYHGDPWASSKAADVVGDVLIAEPATTDAAIVARLQGASEREAQALWQCYWHASPSRFRDPVPEEAIGVIERRAVALLNEDRPISLLERVAETLSNLTDDHDGSAGASLQELVDVLLIWNGKHRDAGKFEVTESTTPLDFLEAQSHQLRVGAVARNLEEALEGRAKANVAAFVAAITPIWEDRAGPSLSDEDRASLVKALGSIRTQEQLDAAEPLVGRVLSSGETAERAAALRALEDMHWRDLTVPRSIQQQVVANLFHEKLWVAIHAIRALKIVDVEPADLLKVINYLLGFAHNYTGEPIRSDDVERALGLALRLAEGQSYESQVAAIALQIVNAMATTDAADALSHLRRLRIGPDWVAAVIRALHPDERSEWFGVHEMKKEDLLEALTEAPREWLKPHWDALEAAAERDLDLIGSWTWAIADLLARHGEHARAAKICQHVVDQTPDTTEHAHRRRTAILITYGHRIDAAVEDPAAARQLLREALEIAAGDEDAGDA